jgi:excisionase family DNA binding protein
MSKPMRMAEAVEYLGICRKTIYNLIWQKKIPCYRPNGRMVCFRREELEGFMLRKRQAAGYGARVKKNWRREMEFGGENENIAILEETAERLKAEGYIVTVQKEYREREGSTNKCYVEIAIRARKSLPVK